MRGGARSFAAILFVSLCLSAGPAQAAFVELIQTSRVGSTSNFDLIYDPEGAASLASLDFVVTTDLPVASITGTQVPDLFDIGIATIGAAGSAFCGGVGSLACVGYGGFSFPDPEPTPGRFTLGTVTVDVGLNPVTNLIQGIPPTIFNSGAGSPLPNNTVDPLATVPEPGALALVGLGLASGALLRRRRATGA